jgi:hypothetical protein
VISEEGTRLGEEAARRLAQRGLCKFEPGLTDAEFAHIRREYDIEFADDHRAFLAAGVPVNVPSEGGQAWSKPWPEWRSEDPAKLRERLNWPVKGVLFDVEHNGFWYAAWGERPTDGAAALAAARLHLADVPVLVPVYGHRYLPAGPGSFGHPVLSLSQTDVICYGLDLVDYMHREFSGARGDVDEGWNPSATVPFWRDLL